MMIRDGGKVKTQAVGKWALWEWRGEGGATRSRFGRGVRERELDGDATL